VKPYLRVTSALFDQLEDFLPQFSTTPAGQSFLAAYRANASINQRSRRFDGDDHQALSSFSL
jgi:hypothetical protein